MKFKTIRGEWINQARKNANKRRSAITLYAQVCYITSDDSSRLNTVACLPRSANKQTLLGVSRVYSDGTAAAPEHPLFIMPALFL